MEKFDENIEQTSDDMYDSSEEGFMKGYMDEEDVDECAECGNAIDEENRISEEINEEIYSFCSQHCLSEFKESMG